MRYNKLVRDNIQEIIEREGKTAVVHTAEEDEFREKLAEKLMEEVGEFIESEDPEELADILEVIHALAESKGLTKEQLEQRRIAKATARGAFQKRLILDEVRE